MEGNLSVDNLHDLNDDDVKTDVVLAFIVLMTNSSSVKSIFFSDFKYPDPTKGQISIDHDLVDDVACGLICSAISRSSEYNFSRRIDQDKADGYWRMRLNSASKLGLDLYSFFFPDDCRDCDHRLRDYINDDRHKWAKEYANDLMDKNFINVEILKIINGQPNWPEKIRLMARKLTELDNAQCSLFMKALDQAYPGMGIASSVENLSGVNYLSHENFMDDQFLAIIEYVASQMMEKSASESCHPTTFDLFEAAVLQFLQGKPKIMQLYRENKEENRLISSDDLKHD
jgi:hypothetical protein